jgi:hypothetical protein
MFLTNFVGSKRWKKVLILLKILAVRLLKPQTKKSLTTYLIQRLSVAIQKANVASRSYHNGNSVYFLLLHWLAIQTPTHTNYAFVLN